jgi:tetratricopeptide (TPR) repeat protein
MRPAPRALLSLLLLLGWGFWPALPPALAAAQPPREPAGVYIDRGLLEYEAGRYGEALKNFREALQLEPEDAEVHYFLGITYLALDRVDQALEHLERARRLDAGDTDIAFNLGVAYVTKGDYARAEAQFRFVRAREPKRENLGYYLGLVHFKRKEYERALGYFDENVSTDVRVQQQNRFYAGLAKHHLGRDVEATQDLAEAVTLRPTSPLGLTAKRFAEAISPRPELRAYRLELWGGVSYDDNARLAPTDPVLELRTFTRESVAEIALLRLEYDLVRTARETFTASYQLLANYYNSVDPLDIVNHTAGASYLRRGALGSLPAWFGAQYGFDYLELDGSLFLTRHTGGASLTLFENDRNFTVVQYRLQHKDFRAPNLLGLQQESRDGQNHLVGATHIVTFAGGRHFLRFGYQFDVDDTDGDDYRYVGSKASIGFQVTGPWELRFQAGYDFHFREYPKKNQLASTLNTLAATGGSVQGAPFRVMRQDHDHIFTVGVWRDFPYGLTAALEFLKERNSSTFSLFDFDRNVVTFSMGWRY